MVRSTPERSATDTWTFILDLIAPAAGEARDELMRVSGVAASVIASEGPKDAPIVVHGAGPRVRIRCLYDDDAIIGDDASEDQLPMSPIDGDWRVSLPTPEEDLDWVKVALAKKSSRVTARAMDEDVAAEESDADPAKASSAIIDPEAFFRA
jgi:hypothetical protein